MVSKERLEELIKQGAIIYDIFKGNIFLVDLTMAKYYEVPVYIEYLNDYYNCNLTRNNYDLFETKEDAEWDLKYSNIVRTERLKLPTWEEIENEDLIHEIYHTPEHNQFELYIYGKYIRIKMPFGTGADKSWERTRGNYINACEWAKKLFLGESV